MIQQPTAADPGALTAALVRKAGEELARAWLPNGAPHYALRQALTHTNQAISRLPPEAPATRSLQKAVEHIRCIAGSYPGVDPYHVRWATQNLEEAIEALERRRRLYGHRD